MSGSGIIYAQLPLNDGGNVLQESPRVFTLTHIHKRDLQ